MRATFFIALRYLFSKKSRNIINIISFISGIAVFVVTAALVIVLSAFNGLEGMVLDIFNTLDPTLKVVPAEGKSFETDSLVLDKIAALPQVESVSRVIEENALFMYGEKQYIGKLKAIEPQWAGLQKIRPYMVDGDTDIFYDSLYACIMGSGVAVSLGVNPNSYQYLSVYFPKRGKKVDLLQPFHTAFAFPQGVFELQKDFDFTYVIVPLEMGDDVLEMRGKISALDIELKPGTSEAGAIEAVQALLPPGLEVQDRLHQHAVALRVMESEKLAIFIILAFIFLIASFNIIGALTMLMVEKRKDTMVLRSLGFSIRRIRAVFFWQGAGIVVLGAMSGLLAGLGICLMQQKWSMVKINSNPEAPAYPVILQADDLLLILLLVLGIGLLTVYLRVRALKANELGLLR